MISWTYKYLNDEDHRILPDGCQDFIIKKTANGQKYFFISDLICSPIHISSIAGEEYIGLRLLPGSKIDIDKFQRIKAPETANDLKNIASELSSLNSNLSEALDCLSFSKTSQKAAQDLGISLRTLQRHIKLNTGKSPEFWRQLARARKAGRLLLSGKSATDVSLDCHFSDQAHLIREVNRWFGVTPSFIQKHSHTPNHWIQQLFDKGYDGPLTGEQISIKKPLRSVT